MGTFSLSQYSKTHCELHMKILLAVDDSDVGKGVCRYTCDKIVRPGDELFLLVVSKEPTFIPGSMSANEIQEQIVYEIHAQKRETARYYRQLLNDREIPNTCMLQKGEIAQSIVEEAEYRGVDLIVLGRRSMGLVERMFSSSCSSKVAEDASCSVLIIKEEELIAEQRQRKELEQIE